MRELVGDPEGEYLRNLLEIGGKVRVHLVEGFLPKPISPKVLDGLAEQWDSVVEKGLENVPEDDQRLYC